MSTTFLLAVAVSGVAAVHDWKTGRIPNWLTLGTAAIGVPLQGLLAWRALGHFEAGLIAIGYALAGAVTCLIVPGILFRLRAMGGGDVKLFGALGILAFPSQGLTIQTYAFAFALLMAPIVLAYQGILWTTLRRGFGRRSRPGLSKDQPAIWFRLGPAIFLGTLVTATMFT